jgi:hypothetical protein
LRRHGLVAHSPLLFGIRIKGLKSGQIFGTRHELGPGIYRLALD